MPHMRTEIDGYWDKFTAYADKTGISLEHKDDWEWAWQLWNAALDAADADYLEAIGQEETVVV